MPLKDLVDGGVMVEVFLAELFVELGLFLHARFLVDEVEVVFPRFFLGWNSGVVGRFLEVEGTLLFLGEGSCVWEKGGYKIIKN